MQIPLRNREGTLIATALVDAEDYDRLAGFRWSLGPSGFARRSVGTRTVLMHREIVGAVTGDGQEVWHENGDELDNRRSNLRTAPSRHRRPPSGDIARPRALVGVEG